MASVSSGIRVFLQPATSVLVAVSMMALQPLRESYHSLSSLTVKDWMGELLITSEPMDLTFFGMKRESSFVELKACLPMRVTFSGIITDVIPLPEKAPSLISFSPVKYLNSSKELIFILFKLFNSVIHANSRELSSPLPS